MTALTPEVSRIKTTLDEFVLAAPDPNAAMAAIVRLWTLAGLPGDDLLDDLEAVAISAGLHRGIELTAPELLESLGQYERAQRIRCAIETGRRQHVEAAQRAARLHDVRQAREVAA